MRFDKPERQQFDIAGAAKKRAEEDKRKIIIRELYSLPNSVTRGVLELIGACGDRSDYFRTCITCQHWESIAGMGMEPPQEKCTLFNILPPGKIIADGCERYNDDDDIPF